MDPLFQVDDGIGLERPPVGQLGPGEALGAPMPAPAATVALVVCPNCGCQDCGSQHSQMADGTSVTCPVCQSEFAPEQPGMGAEMALPMESSVHRILGRLFERHVRRRAHALKRVSHITELPKLPGNAS